MLENKNLLPVTKGQGREDYIKQLSKIKIIKVHCFFFLSNPETIVSFFFLFLLFDFFFLYFSESIFQGIITFYYETITSRNTYRWACGPRDALGNGHCRECVRVARVFDPHGQ